MKAHERLPTDYLNDIRDASEKAARFVAGLTFEEFRDNDEKVYAVIRALEVIGEAAKNIPLNLRRRSRCPLEGHRRHAGQADPWLFWR